MIRIALSRLVTAPFQILGLVVVVFLLLHVASGDPAFLLAGPQATATQVATIRHDLGLDQSLPVQFWRYLERAVHGDLGKSLQTGNTVTYDLLHRAPATLELILLALIAITLVTILLVGVVLARPHRLVRRVIGGYGFLAGALPDFWVGLALIAVVYAKLGLAAAPSGQLDARVSIPRSTGVATLDAAMSGNWSAFGNALSHLVLPVVTLTLVYMAPVVRLLSVVSARTMSADFMRFADSWGISPRRRVWYAMYHAFPTLVVSLASTLVYLLGGAVLVETVFSWGGIGQYAVDAVTHSDFAAMQGFVILAGIFTIAVYAFGDILHAFVDPKVRRVA
jgi:ABC-type dipeptide/oligopeptide/nickel transport system permease component